MVRRPALDRDAAPRRHRRRGAGSSAAGRPCTGGDGRVEQVGRRSPLSTTNPAYITSIRWVMPGDHAEVVGDQDERRAACSRRRARAAARGPAPGSSRRARSWARRRSAAWARARAPSRSSRAGASRRENWCGKSLSRVSRLRDADHRRAARSRGPAASAWLTPAVRPDRLDHLLLDGEHRVEAGHRVLEDHRDVAAADRRASRPPTASTRSWPSNMHACRPRSGRPACGSSRMIARLVTLLPQPDSPTRPRRLALLELEGDAVDGVDGAFVGAEPDDEVLDREQQGRGGHRRSRGSSDSRSPSPSRLNPTR